MRPAQAAQETTHMQDLILAVVFLAMIIAPAIVTMPPDRDERDSL
jgi:hypothetical protein